MTEQSVVWLGSSREVVRRFPSPARRAVGFQIRRVQQGLDPDDWKPMPSVGLGVREIRIHTELDHRVLYVARFHGLICVIAAFEKRSRKTSGSSLELAKRWLRSFEADWLRRRM